jgi:hypothetical protein
MVCLCGEQYIRLTITRSHTLVILKGWCTRGPAAGWEKKLSEIMQKIKSLALAAIFGAGIFVSANLVAQSDCTTTTDCSTNGKSPVQWCESGSGNCLCTIIISCPQQ